MVKSCLGDTETDKTSKNWKYKNFTKEMYFRTIYVEANKNSTTAASSEACPRKLYQCHLL